MPKNSGFFPLRQTLKRYVLVLLLPRLLELKPYEWDLALRRARETAFDSFEWVGVLIGVAATTWLLRMDTSQSVEMSLPLRFLFQYLMAMPLLFVLAGGFYLRRTRRGLDSEIARQHASCRASQR